MRTSASVLPIATFRLARVSYTGRGFQLGKWLFKDNELIFLDSFEKSSAVVGICPMISG
jgi:hypothetical protein